MNLRLVTILFFTSCAALNISTANAMTMRKYTSECTPSLPLYTQDSCGRSSYYGRIAADCAEFEAMANCDEGPNTDCVLTPTRVWAENSDEFVGYKKCVARAIVHGYGP